MHTHMNHSRSVVESMENARDRRPLILVENLSHAYGEGDIQKQVLFDNCLTVNRGEIVIMTGPSGSGKTTLLTLIGTLRRVQKGSLKLFGAELNGASSANLIELRKQLGFIFQAHNLFGSLTAYQNVRMAMELFDFQKAEMHQRITQILTRLGLGERIHYKPDALSGGQKQRVAIARGLAHSPKLILADEPTAALDKKSGREVVTIFQEMARQHGCAILMVTHDNRILDVADRIVNMVDGYIRSDVLVKESSVLCEFLKRCDVFRDLTPRTLTSVADQLEKISMPAGQTLIRQGEPGDKFYLIRSGCVEVSQSEAGTEKKLAELGVGDFFGEAALLTGAPRNATVVTKKESVLYALDKEEFQSAVAASDSFEEELRKALFQRQ